MEAPHLIGIAGPSGAGKTALARALARQLTGDTGVVVSLDAYYRDQSTVEAQDRGTLNFDTPEALDVELLLVQLRQLATGQAIERPVYDFRRHLRTTRMERLVPGSIVVAEGLLALHVEDLRALFGTRVFIGADDETCLARRVARDARDRGRSEATVQRQWETTVRPMCERYVTPTQQYADLVLDGTVPLEQNVTAVLQRLPLRA